VIHEFAAGKLGNKRIFYLSWLMSKEYDNYANEDIQYSNKTEDN